MHSVGSAYRRVFSGSGRSWGKRRILIWGLMVIALGSSSPAPTAARAPIQGVWIEAKDLTPTEMAQVRQLARPTGKEPWLIHGFRFGPGAKSTRRRTRLEIYLEPEVENGSLRRGRVLHTEISAPVAGGRYASPRIKSTGKYARIVVHGRPATEVKGKWDLSGPFQVHGEFDDQTLLSLVALIRSSPQGPPLPNGGLSGKIDGSLAISDVRRTDNGVEVRLNADDYHGQYVTLEDRNGRFVIVQHGAWIV
jgi:hypothetical protein